NPVRKPGIVLDVGRDGQLPAGLHALEDETVDVRAGEIERGGASRRPRSDDDDLVIGDTFHAAGIVVQNSFGSGCSALSSASPICCFCHSRMAGTSSVPLVATPA